MHNGLFQKIKMKFYKNNKLFHMESCFFPQIFSQVSPNAQN